MALCKRCSKELGSYCSDCVEHLINEGITKLEEERKKKSLKGIVVFKGDPMYEAIMARRDLESRRIK